MQCFRYMQIRAFASGVTAVLELMLPTFTGHSAIQQPASWLGTWNLNLAKSSERADAPRYKRVTTRIEPWQDGLRVSYDMVGIRGGVTHTEWTGRFDGKDYPMQCLDYVMTNAYRRIDDRSYEIVIKVEGAATATAHVAVSADGRTLTVSTEQRTANGNISKTTSIYDKQ